MENCNIAQASDNSAMEQAVVEKLRRIFPDGEIYSDTWNERHSKINMGKITYPNVRSCWTAADLSKEDWLNKQGFHWHNMESFMAKDEAFPPESLPLEEYVPFIFAHQCLIGMVNLTDARKRELYDKARAVFFDKICRQQECTRLEEEILVLEMVQMLKTSERNKASSDGIEEKNLWGYLILQFCGSTGAFRNCSTTIVQGHLCVVINDVLGAKKSYLCPHKGHMKHVHQQYRDTLNAHALAPTDDIFLLFDELLSFYDSLHYQYSDSDNSVDAFIQAELDRIQFNEKNKNLPNKRLSASLASLFNYAPKYMKVFCSRILSKFDSLDTIPAISIGEQAETSSYLDTLLAEWYASKSNEIWVTARNCKATHHEMVAKTKDAIIPRYAYHTDSQCVSIELPCIFLGHQEEEKPLPAITIYNDEMVLFSGDISFYGNDAIITNAYSFALGEQKDDALGTVKFRIVISFNGKKFYDSGQRLYRDWIMFAENGAERASPEKLADSSGYLYVPNNENVEVLPKQNCQQIDVIRQLPHPGKLYSVDFSLCDALYIGNHEILFSESVGSQFRVSAYPPAAVVDGAFQSDGNEKAHIYSQTCKFVIFPPKDVNLAKFQMAIDDDRRELRSVELNNSGAIEFSAVDDGSVHTIELVDTEKKHLVTMLDTRNGLPFNAWRYVIHPGFFYHLDKEIYRDGNDSVTIQAGDEKTSGSHTFELQAGSDEAQIAMSDGKCYLFHCPTASVEIDGTSAFNGYVPALWHDNISDTTAMKVALPDNMQCQVLLGDTSIPRSAASSLYEIGSFIHVHDAAQTNMATLRVIISNQYGKTIENWLVWKIYYQPTFFSLPVQVRDGKDGKIYWNGESNFIGPADAVFRVEIEADGETLTFHPAQQDSILETERPLPDGKYPYHVFAEKASLFGTKCYTFDYTLYVGDINAFRWRDKCLRLSRYVYWDNDKNALLTIPMNPTTTRIEKLLYQGLREIPGFSAGDDDDSELVFPMYIAVMSYWNSAASCWQEFSSDEDSPDFEFINPIHVWRVSERYIEAKTCTDDGLYIDGQHNSVLKKSTREGILDEAKKLIVADGFEYSEEKI